jgi:hypothetical protein
VVTVIPVRIIFKVDARPDLSIEEVASAQFSVVDTRSFIPDTNVFSIREYLLTEGGKFIGGFAIW